MAKLFTYNDVECMVLIIATGSGAKAAKVKGVSSTSVCEIRICRWKCSTIYLLPLLHPLPEELLPQPLDW